MDEGDISVYIWGFNLSLLPTLQPLMSLGEGQVGKYMGFFRSFDVMDEINLTTGKTQGEQKLSFLL